MCPSYCLGKAHQLPFPSFSNRVYTKPLELIYTGIWGPNPISLINNSRYYVHLINAFSRFTWIYLLSSKSQIKSIFEHFQTMVELQLGTKIKTV
ncbi:hypothetical protein AHAS_Ahas04G0166900 [Arachis hypogaea]